MENRKAESVGHLTVTRVRHPVKFRLLQVKRVTKLAPNFVRITFTGDNLQDFVSASFDDHVKVFFPNPGEDKPALPTMGPDGPVFPNGKPVMRDFTPRRFDQQARELDIEFASKADTKVQWLYRDATGNYGEALLGALKQLQLPEEREGYVWAAGESAVMRAARQFLVGERGIAKSRIRAASYWWHGAEGVHENIDD